MSLLLLLWSSTHCCRQKRKWRQMRHWRSSQQAHRCNWTTQYWGRSNRRCTKSIQWTLSWRRILQDKKSRWRHHQYCKYRRDKQVHSSCCDWDNRNLQKGKTLNEYGLINYTCVTRIIIVSIWAIISHSTSKAVHSLQLY